MDSYDRRKQKMDSLAKLNNIVRTRSSEEVEKLLDHELKGQDILNEATEHGQGFSPLMIACRIKDQDNLQSMIELLVRKGANVDWQNKSGWTALMKAVKENRIKVVRYLLSRNVDLELQNHEPASALMIACKQGDMNMVKLLLENNAQFDVIGQYKDYTGYNQSYDQSYFRKSPLVIAIENDHKDLAKLLLDKGASVVVGECDALTVACKKEDTDLVKILLDNKTVDVNFNNGEPMMHACSSKNSEIVELLLKKGAKVGLLHSRESPLMIAAKQNKMEIFQQILAYSTPNDINLTDKWEGNSVLMMVIERGINVHSVTKMKMLLDKGADVNLKNKDGDNTLMIILSLIRREHNDSSEVYDIVKILLDAGAIIHKKRLSSWSYPTVNPYSVRLSKLLLDKGINFVSVLSGKNETPLLVFTTSGQKELVKLCLDRGDDVNECDDSGVYPLWRAIKMKHFDVFELLFERNADASICPNDELPALDKLKEDKVLLADFLQRAAEKKNYELVEFLLTCGADAMAVNVNTKKSALEVLKTNSIPSIMEMTSRSEAYTKLRQLLMSHPAEVEKLVYEMPATVPINIDISGTNDIEELNSYDGNPSVSDQSSVKKRRRESEDNVSDDDIPAKKPRDNVDEQVNRIAQAVADDKKMDHKHADSIFLGPTGSGKTSLLYRIIRKTQPIDCSTSVAEDVTVIELDSSTCKEVDIKKSLAEQVYAAACSEQAKEALSSSTSTELPVSEPPSRAPSANFVDQSASSVAPADEQSIVIAATPTVALTNPPVSSDSDLIQTDDLKQTIKAVMKQSKDCGNIEERLKSSLYMRDVGGQVEFQEIVSLLVFGPSIFFFVFRADKKFDEKFDMEYRKSPSESINKYTSSITLEEALLQSLTSVYALDTPAAAVKPSVFIVATHKDQLGPLADQKIEELNEHLDSLVTNYGFHDLVQYADAGKGQVMFTVNNKSEDEEDFDLIRLKLHSLIIKDEKFTIKDYPVRHLLFSLELRSEERSILSLEECKVKAAKYGIKDNEVVSLLKFLHRIGVVQYYDVEGVRHIVVRKPEVLFGKTTDVITSTFLSDIPCTLGQVKDYKEKGILPYSLLKSFFSSEDCITCEDFVTILEHHHIIVSIPGAKEKSYFIPCVLNHVPEAPEDDARKTDVTPLAVRFKCKHCPKGIFGVLVTYLMAPKTEDSNVSLDLLRDKIYKDQVSFEVCLPGLHDELSLRLYMSHIEVKYFPDLSEDPDRSLGEICNAIRQLLEISMVKSIENLNYNRDSLKPTYCSKDRTSHIPTKGSCWHVEIPRYNKDDLEKLFIKHKPLHPPRKKTEKRKKLEAFGAEVEIILQTVNENEFQAAVTLIKPPNKFFSKAVTFPSAGSVVGKFADKKIALIQTDVGDNAGDYIQDALDTFPNAEYVIGVGVCYAFDPQKYKLGDVLVSKKISDLKNLKFNSDGLLTDRGQTIDMVNSLISGFCMDLTLKNGFEVSKNTKRKSQVYTGRLISYSAFMDHKETRNKFRDAVPEAIGGEMEGGVLLEFERKRKVKGVIVVKGVVDYADGDKEKGWQFTAAMAALHYLHNKMPSFRP